MERTINTKFFCFNQNNSGGCWMDDHSVGIGRTVIIEAIDLDDAVNRGEQIGLYFDGYGDCSCCGNRWSSWASDEEYPHYYGTKMIPCEEKTDAFIHNFDGSFSYAKEYVDNNYIHTDENGVDSLM
jgi:hypothetical protein